MPDKPDTNGNEEVLEPIPGTPEYDEALVQLAEDRLIKPFETTEDNNDDNSSEEDNADDAQSNNDESDKEPLKKPEGVPDKYWDKDTGVINFAAWNKETEYHRQKASEKAQQKPAENADSDDGESGDDNTDGPEGNESDKTDAPATLNMQALQEEFAATGELSEQSYENLEKLGFDKGFVDSYVAGQQAVKAAAEQKLYDAAGGKAEYEKMLPWAAAKLSAEEVTEFNKSIDSGDANRAIMAISGLADKYKAAQEQTPNLQNGDEEVRTGNGYSSKAAMIADMNDPKYDTDPAFRAEVEKKIAASPNSIFNSQV